MAQSPLSFMPSGHGVRFLGRQFRKEQLREPGLPRERFGFVHRQFEHVLICVQPIAKFRHDRGLHFFDLRQEFFA